MSNYDPRPSDDRALRGRDPSGAHLARSDYGSAYGSRDLEAPFASPDDWHGGPEAPAPEWSARRKAVTVVLLVVAGLLSFFVVGEYASSAEAHGTTIAALDNKKDTVMTLVAGSSGTSTAITLLPGDAGTPIAEKLVDLSSDFLVVIAAIYLEKYLLTVIGFLTFKVIVPLASLLLCIAVLMRGNLRTRVAIVNFVAKAVLFGLAMYFVVPVSVFVSGMIEDTYEASLNETLANAQAAAEHIEKSAEEESGSSSEGQGLLETLQSIPSAITQIPEGVSNLVDEAKESLNNFIEALAVMVVTSCLIPILVLVFFLWLVKSILGIDVDLAMGFLRPRSVRWKRK